MRSLYTSTHGPHTNDPLFGPRYFIIQTETSIFSPPRSPRTFDGALCFSMAFRNSLRTVEAQLLLLARRPTTCMNIIGLLTFRVDIKY